MATEKVRVLKIDNEEITTKKGDKRPMRVLHCFVEQSYQDAKTGEIVDGSFVAKTSVFDESIELTAGEEYLVEYRLGEGYGMDAGRMVPRIAAWRSMKQRPVAKPAATAGS